MPILADVHVHSNHSGDSQASLTSQIEKAISLGMQFICFTDHNDFDFPYMPEDLPDMFLLNVPVYQAELLSLKKKYQDQINILFGVELGLDHSVLAKNQLLAKTYPFDFIIGSSHLCHGKDPYYASFYENRNEKAAHREYFESILENIKEYSDYDVYGHLDYVVRYGPTKNSNYSYPDHADVLDEILKRLIEAGKGIEANTGGYRCGLGCTNPSIDILKRYHALGGEILTIGSDAHDPKDLGAHFAETAELLKQIGFRYYCIFENRKPTFLRL